MDVADYLLQYMENNNLSIYKFAKLTKLNEKTIRNILCKKTTPSIKTCYKIMKTTNDDFFLYILENSD